MWIDTHAHLADPRLAGELESVRARARAAGVVGVVAVATDLADSVATVAIARRHPEIAATVGIHPHNAADAPADWRARLRDLAHSPEVVAVGETGLDYHYRHSPPEVQRRLFLDQLELAAELGRPVVVHNREADDDLVAILRDGGRHVRGVLHCFAGGDALLEAALEAGWYASFAGLVTFRSFDGVDRLRRVPLTRLLVETDSPYLTPVPFRGRRNEPAYVALVGRKVAELRDQDEATVAAATARNAESLFARAWS